MDAVDLGFLGHIGVFYFQLTVIVCLILLMKATWNEAPKWVNAINVLALTLNIAGMSLHGIIYLVLGETG